MRKILLAIRKKTLEEYARIDQTITRDVESVGGEYIIKDYDDLFMCLDGENSYVKMGDLDLNDVSLILIRKSPSKDAMNGLRSFLDHKQFIQPYKITNDADNKLWQYCIFARDRVKIPRTIFVPKDGIRRRQKQIVEILKYPLIVKAIRGHAGESVYLLSNDEDFENFYTIADESTQKNIEFVFQAKVENDFDVRVLVLNGQAVKAFKRIPGEGEWKNNTHLGAHIEVYDKVPDDIAEIAIQATTSVGLMIGGVDVVFDKVTKELRIFEVNPSPSMSNPDSPTLDVISRFIAETLSKI